MVDTVADLAEGMRDICIRHVVMVTALLKLGEPLTVTRADAFDAAAHDVDVQSTDDGFRVALKPAPVRRR